MDRARHGPGEAEPGGPHDGERGRGHHQARAVTRPYRGRARLPRLVSWEHRRIQDVTRRRGRMDRGGNKSGYALAPEGSWGVGRGSPGAVAVARLASTHRRPSDEASPQACGMSAICPVSLRPTRDSRLGAPCRRVLALSGAQPRPATVSGVPHRLRAVWAQFSGQIATRIAIHKEKGFRR